MNVTNNEIPVVWYDFTIHSCSSTKKAKIISQETENANTSDKGTVSAMVSIIPKIWAKPIKQSEGKIRNYFCEHSIQIGNMFAVPITIYPKFKSDLDILLNEYYLAVDTLINVAQTGELYEVAKKQLSQIGDKENIKLPTPEAIREGYSVDVYVDCNFSSERTQMALKVLSNDIKEKIEQEVKLSAERKSGEQQKAIMETVLKPVKALIKDIQDRCTREDDSKVVWKTLVDKIKHITEVLPQYNINNDPEIVKMFDTIKEKFGSLDKELLKENGEVRKIAVEHADQITIQFGSMFD